VTLAVMLGVACGYGRKGVLGTGLDLAKDFVHHCVLDTQDCSLTDLIEWIRYFQTLSTCRHITVIRVHVSECLVRPT